MYDRWNLSGKGSKSSSSSSSKEGKVKVKKNIPKTKSKLDAKIRFELDGLMNFCFSNYVRKRCDYGRLAEFCWNLIFFWWERSKIKGLILSAFLYASSFFWILLILRNIFFPPWRGSTLVLSTHAILKIQLRNRISITILN